MSRRPRREESSWLLLSGGAEGPALESGLRYQLALHSVCPFLCKLERTIVTMSQGCYED